MRRGQVVVLAALFVCYGSFYLCRANVEAAMPLLLLEGYDKTRLGQLSSIATFTYAIGKIVLGGTGDVLGGRRLMVLALTGSVVCSLGFGLQHAFAAMVILAAANRFFQSGGWSGVVHVVSRWFDPGRHGLVMGILSTSYELGNVAALTLSGFVARWGWRALFVVNPLLLAAVGGIALAVMRGRPPIETPEGGTAIAPAEPRLTLGEILPPLLRRASFWTAVVLSALLTFIRVGFLTWTPTYLYEVSRATGHAEISGSIVKSAMFPAAGVVAALAVGVLSDRLGPGRRAPIMALSLAVVVVLVLTLAHAGLRDPFAAALLIAGIGLFLLGPYSLMAGAIALDVAGKRGTATATGIIDGAGYLGATASGYILGRLADRAGWPAAFDVIAAVAFAATAVSGAWAVVAMGRRA